jgi:ADP-heptose:LPS heptosyltransferase
VALSSRPRILVLRALGLGDLLTGVPALRALRAAYPEHELVLAAPTALQPLVDLTGAVDCLLATRPLEQIPWEGRPPELSVNLHGSGPESHELLLRLGAGRLVAFASTPAGVEGPRWDPAEHEVARWCRLLRESLGVPTDPTDVLLTLPDVEPLVTDAVVIHPGAAFPARRWPPDRFAAVARWASERGHEIVVTGGPDERRLAEQVAEAAGLRETAVLAGRTDLGQLSAVVAAARLVVCGDTGVAHLASGYRTASVLLFGPTPPSRWGPPPAGPHTVLWRGEGSGSPFAESPDPALLEITVADVLHAAEERLTAVVEDSVDPSVV